MSTAGDVLTTGGGVLRVERVAPDWAFTPAGYGVATADAAAAAGSTRHVLVPLETARQEPTHCDLARQRPVPAGIAPDTAILAPLLAESLRAGDVLELEVGTVVIIAGGSPWTALMAEIFAWYGASPQIVGTASSDAVAADDDVEHVPLLATSLRSRPAVAAIELTGTAGAIDLILETCPRLSRVLFAGPRRDRCTVDYYMNVHRKGLHLRSTVLSPAAALGRDALLERAFRLLESNDRAAACRRAIGRDVDR